jgi:hypothetical protein
VPAAPAATAPPSPAPANFSPRTGRTNCYRLGCDPLTPALATRCQRAAATAERLSPSPEDC